MKSRIVLCGLLFSLAFAYADDKKVANKPDTASTRSFTGQVSDSMCGKSHMMPGKSAAECAKECAKDGDYALVVGDKVYTLKGHKPELEKLAGASATVTGSVKGDTIEVATVSASKTALGKGAGKDPSPKKD